MFISSVPSLQVKFGSLYVVDTVNNTADNLDPHQIVKGFLKQETLAASNQPHTSIASFIRYVGNAKNAKGGWILPDEIAKHVIDETDEDAEKKVAFLVDDTENDDATEFGIRRQGNETSQKAFLKQIKTRAKSGVVFYGKPMDIPSHAVTLDGNQRIAARGMKQPVYALILDAFV